MFAMDVEYEEVVSSILAIPRYKKKANLETVSYLLRLLHHPLAHVKVIHVAGTNGKGSVCAYLDSIGKAQGYSMGLFTSPHLLTIRERMRVGGEMISESDFVLCYKKVRQAEEQMLADGGVPATFFEVIFCMAAVYFAEKHVDYAIVEAGIGGRSDTTNIVHPVLSIITSVGLDHVAILGDTISQIAYEKAGVLKTSVPAVIGLVPEEAKEVIRRYGEEIDASCQFIEEYGLRILKNRPEGIDFSLDCGYDKEGFFHTGLMGAFQAFNAAVAILAAKRLFDIPYSVLFGAIADTVWEGRMEEVAPRFYVDGAHNEEAMHAFADTVLTCFGDKPKVVLYAVANDKDDVSMLRELLLSGVHTIVVSELLNERRTDVQQVGALIRQEARLLGIDKIEIKEMAELSKALDYVRAIQNTKDYVFCVGSLYLVAAVKEVFND